MLQHVLMHTHHHPLSIIRHPASGIPRRYALRDTQCGAMRHGEIQVATGILNKMTAETFDSLSKQLLECEIDSEWRVKVLSLT